MANGATVSRKKDSPPEHAEDAETSGGDDRGRVPRGQPGQADPVVARLPRRDDLRALRDLRGRCRSGDDSAAPVRRCGFDGGRGAAYDHGCPQWTGTSPSTPCATPRVMCTRRRFRTPLIRLDYPERDVEIYLKLETLQPIGSFKIRGAWNALRQLSRPSSPAASGP